MKSAAKAVALFVLLEAMLLHAQTYTVPYFEHVVIVIQENRTPDNLFGAATLAPYPATLPALGPGYDLATNTSDPTNAVGWCLGSCFDPGHGNQDWQRQDGLLNGNPYNACANSPGIGSSCPSKGGGFTCNGSTMVNPGCPQETYVSPSYDANQASFGGIVPTYPYFDIAAKYGFANYFFQTNQGPSQPAHDFLFGGTSAPSGSSLDSWYGAYYQTFAANNPQDLGAHYTDCNYQTQAKVALVFPDAQQKDQNGQKITESPCFDHLTLADLLTSNSKTWKYYARRYYDIWDAPAGIAHICYGPGWTQNSFPYPCENNPGFTANVVVPSETFFADVPLGGTGINAPPPPGQGGQGQPSCQLPNVTWIIPNGSWSDHPGPSGTGVSTTTELGPDWVANIINAVGSSNCVDEIGNHPWQDTVILVVWDDWGGFYDHVGAGLGAQYVGGPVDCFFSTSWGCGYTYGFRVPFLVASQYTAAGYVSGACTPGVSCVGNGGSGSMNVAPYQHDFGSILAFIENNFNLGVGSINTADCPNPGAMCSLFADNYYPEGQALPPGPYLPLGDFFPLYSGSENFNNGQYCSQRQSTSCPRTTFDPITLASGTCTVSGKQVPCYGVQYFVSHGDGQMYDPDNDASDPED